MSNRRMQFMKRAIIVGGRTMSKYLVHLEMRQYILQIPMWPIGSKSGGISGRDDI
jgi:hypothetical protein